MKRKINPKILLLTPPLMAPNCPYPATPFLTAYLRSRNLNVFQDDFSIRLLSTIFTRKSLAALSEIARANSVSINTPVSVPAFLTRLPQYLNAIEPAVEFLRSSKKKKVPVLPDGPRYSEILELMRANHRLGEKAAADNVLKAGLFLDDVSDFIRDGVDPRFGFARYAESIAISAPSFAPVKSALDSEPSPIDLIIDEIAADSAASVRPDILGISIPFPGCLYSACRIAAVFRKKLPKIKIVFGGGYVSTELRSMTDTGIFDYVDALCFDDGEIPLELFANSIADNRDWTKTPQIASAARLPAETLALATAPRLPHYERPAPVYDGLPLNLYFSTAESVNPMHRLWSDRFWNKLVLAHGCYWGKCAFCDTSLDYISRFDSADADTVIKWMDSVSAETGCKSFHFADEAAPPALLRTLSEKLARRKRPYEWWTNIRLDRSFDDKLAHVMADGGCIAVSAGLECATDRLLKLMNKGITTKDAFAACKSLSSAGLLVHLYMMYGFPTQTKDEAIESLDILRKLFKRKYVHSAFWHRFALTCHSAAFIRRRELGMRTLPCRHNPVFAKNEVRFREANCPDWNEIGDGLAAAVYNYQRGIGLNLSAKEWFE